MVSVEVELRQMLRANLGEHTFLIDLSPPTTRLGRYSVGFVGAVVPFMFALGMFVSALDAAGLPNLAGYRG